MSNPVDKDYYILKSIEELKHNHTESHLKIESITKDFYKALQEHMDKGDARWEHIKEALTALRIEESKIKEKISLQGNVFNKLWAVLGPVLVAVILHIYGLFSNI